MRIILNMELNGLPPTINRMYRGLHGHRYKTKDCLKYQAQTIEKMRSEYENLAPSKKNLYLRIMFITNNRRRWDIDNRVKALQDCLIHAGIIQDDSQIQILHLEKKLGSHDVTQLTLRELDE
ncbi:MAG: RusA family crossover junction endodeoxyribonuclease [Synergistaceae bacterium]|nr:RusA family crossover junction endodeoxyribonuclease [Synergistaceae bacterium]